MKSVVMFAILFLSFFANAEYPMKATYQVPGFGDSEDAVYELTFDIVRTGDEVAVQYVLPKNLTGIPNFIDAVGEMKSDTFAVLEGPTSKLKCDLAANTCNVKYHDLKFDLDAVKLNLKKSGFNPEQVERRLEVSRRFVIDPEGVITYQPR